MNQENNYNQMTLQQNNHLKKNNKGIIIFALLLIVCIIVGVIFFNNRIKSREPVEELGNDEIHDFTLQHISYKNKDIVLTDNFSEFVNQFNGMGCELMISNIPNLKYNIDSYNKDYFEQLTVPEYDDYIVISEENNKIDIICESSIVGETVFGILFDTNDKDNQGILYSDRNIIGYTIDNSSFSYSPIVVFDVGNISINLESYPSTKFYEVFGKYDNVEINNKEIKITYKTKDYNISLYTYGDSEDDLKNDVFEFHTMDIIINKSDR